MVDDVSIPKGWRLADPKGVFYKGQDPKQRRRTINDPMSYVVGVLVWDPNMGSGEVLLHPQWMPGNVGRNLTVHDSVGDFIQLLTCHYDYTTEVDENLERGKQ
jgi:hypothetical protein